MASTFEKLDLSGIENITKSNLSSNTIGILDISSATNIESYAIQSCIIEDKIIFSDDLTTFKSVFLHSSVINQFNIPKNLNKVEANAFYQIVYDGVLDFTNIDVDFEENAFFGAGINKLLLKNQMNLNNSFISSFEIIESTSYIPYEYRNLCVNLKYIDTKDVTRICDFAYEYCIGPDTTVIISDTVISIGSNAFTKSLTFGDKIGNIFFESESLPEDLHPNWNPDNILYYLKGQWEYENGVPKVKHL